MAEQPSFPNIPGKVVGIRLPESVYTLLLERAKKNHLTVSKQAAVILEGELCRKHQRKGA